MDLITTFESAFRNEIAGKTSEFTMLLEGVINREFAEQDLAGLAKHIETNFFKFDVTQRSSAFFLLMKADRQRAYLVAKKALQETYETTRTMAGHLHSLLVSIDDFEHFLRASSCLEVEKNLRIAYALINDIEIIDGDFNPSARKN
ncbi:hypothetical protein [Xylophilus sp. Leaf220]|uniref:hypothetical protein n=1 Tax=Xylophilus sp. Leaf220 TaxID=1735686 RepID=UPI0012E0F5CA|nr:hypothetical protein [Xylophilus sp. Leaf220]